MPWRTKTGPARPVEHPTRAAADAWIDDVRRRYQAGAAALRVVRLYDPQGGVTLIDFAREAQDAAKAIRDVERATAARVRAIAEATERWETAIARAAALGRPVDDIAAAAGVNARDVRAILRRRS